MIKVEKNGLIFVWNESGLTVNIFNIGEPDKPVTAHTIAEPTREAFFDHIDTCMKEQEEAETEALSTLFEDDDEDDEEDKDELQEERQAEINSESINEGSSADPHYPGD